MGDGIRRRAPRAVRKSMRDAQAANLILKATARPDAVSSSILDAGCVAIRGGTCLKYPKGSKPPSLKLKRLSGRIRPHLVDLQEVRSLFLTASSPSPLGETLSPHVRPAPDLHDPHRPAQGVVARATSQSKSSY